MNATIDGPLYLLFQDPQIGGERAFMPASDLVECGTPITEQGDDMDYTAYTTTHELAVECVQHGATVRSPRLRDGQPTQQQ